MDAPGFISLLNDHGFEDTSSTRKMEAVNDAQWDLSSREPWPFLEKQIDLTFSGASGVPTNLPADLGQVLQVVNVQTGATISPSRNDDYTKWYVLNAADVADPLKFYFIGKTMKFHPIPAASTTVRMIYTCIPTAVTETSLETDFIVPPRHHRAIAYLALAHLYLMEDDPENAQSFAQLAEQRIQNMRPDIWERQLQDPDYIHIVDFDDTDYYG